MMRDDRTSITEPFTFTQVTAMIPWSVTVIMSTTVISDVTLRAGARRGLTRPQRGLRCVRDFYPLDAYQDIGPTPAKFRADRPLWNPS